MTNPASDEMIAEIEAGLEGVTPGSWQVIVTEHDWALKEREVMGQVMPAKKGVHIERRIFTTWDHPQSRSPYPVVNISFGVGIEDEKSVQFVSIDDANAIHLARMSPDNVRAILARLKAAETVLAEAERAHDATCQQAAALEAELAGVRSDLNDVGANWLKEKRRSEALEAENARLTKELAFEKARADTLYHENHKHQRCFHEAVARAEAAEARQSEPSPHLCGHADLGTYTGQVILPAPDWLKHKWPTGIGIDVCLALEIQDLWRKGIRTTGHCCGHGSLPGYISVWPEYVEQMKALGYVADAHPEGWDDHFSPKTKLAIAPEREVTEAMVDAFVERYELGCNHRYDRNSIRFALTAALAADRSAK